MRQKVVVTGLGVICGLGLHWEPFWAGLLAGRSAVRRWALESGDDFPVHYAAPVDMDAFERSFSSVDELRGPMERRCRFGQAAARQALIDAGLLGRAAEAGVAIGSGVPERSYRDMLLALGDQGPMWERLYARRRELSPDTRDGNDQLSLAIARTHGCHGPVMNFSTACAGAAHAIGTAFRMIRRGESECMLAGGADSVLNLLTMTGLHLLGAPSIDDKHGEKLCRPFDADRSGFVAAEGGGIVVLESEERAKRRGARIYAELCGFGTSLDAYRITAPHPDGDGAVLAMRKALNDARMDPQRIDYVNAHGTSTPLNDKVETKAIKRVFSQEMHYRRLVVNANKSQIGHLIAAAGAPEFIATALALKFGKVPPTLNLESPDLDCDLDYVPQQSRSVSLQAAISNSFGFGGLNACLALARYQGATA